MNVPGCSGVRDSTRLSLVDDWLLLSAISGEAVSDDQDATRLTTAPSASRLFPFPAGSE